MKQLFFLGLGFVLYTYLIYPIIICILSRLLGRGIRHNYDYQPLISVIISAYNEGQYLEEKVNSIFNGDYPKDKIEILIGLDGCTDNSEDILNNLKGKGVGENLYVYSFPERRGKPAVLNDLLARTNRGIIVFTDARQVIDKNAISILVSALGDESVGSASGELVFTNDDGEIRRHIGLYWRYEKFIRRCESRLHSMIGATGALYAMKRSYIRELPSDIILDDIYQPLNAVRRGKRAVFCQNAFIYDRVEDRREYDRKVRTLIGNFQLVAMNRWILSLESPIVFQFLSHKMFRLFVPYAFLLMLVSSAILAVNSWAWLVVFLLQVLVYSYASGLLLWNRRVNNRFASFIYTFSVLNLAAVEALIRFLSGRYTVKWKKD